MSDMHSPQHPTRPPAHEDFHWIFGHGRQAPCTDFIELARDASAGVRSCPQIIYSSALVREMNLDADPEQLCAPAISKADADHLLRLSLVAISTLHQAAQKEIDALNQV